MTFDLNRILKKMGKPTTGQKNNTKAIEFKKSHTFYFLRNLATNFRWLSMIFFY